VSSDPPRTALTDIDALWRMACEGNTEAFGDWTGRVERPVRRSLARFATVVDAEAVVQEALTRMWLLSQDPARRLAGENASLRWALGVARNLAMNEVRKRKRHEVLLEPLIEDELVPPPEPDPLLMQRIRECVGKLTGQLARVMELRVKVGHALPDARLAGLLQMTKNTFLQNVTRARRQVAMCLEGLGIGAEDLAR
jgi:DNA-directed RNA polymerase specialized sigma24 family protein